MGDDFLNNFEIDDLEMSDYGPIEFFGQDGDQVESTITDSVNNQGEAPVLNSANFDSTEQQSNDLDFDDLNIEIPEDFFSDSFGESSDNQNSDAPSDTPIDFFGDSEMGTPADLFGDSGDFFPSDLPAGPRQITTSKTKEFPKQFYVSYFGFNPLVILKEEPDVLCSIIRQRPNTLYLKCLESNINGNRVKRQEFGRTEGKIAIVKGFIDYIEDFLADNFTVNGFCTSPELREKLLKKYSNIISYDNPDEFFRDYYTQCNEIVTCFKDRWSILQREINLRVPSTRKTTTPSLVSRLLKNRGNNKDILSLFNINTPKSNTSTPRSPLELTNRIFADILQNMKDYTDIINYICILVPDMKQSDSRGADDTKKTLDEYITRKYTYGFLGENHNIPELGILSDMGFPTAIAGNEDLIKSSFVLTSEKQKNKRPTVNSTALENTKFISFIFSANHIRKAEDDDQHYWAPCRPKF